MLFVKVYIHFVWKTKTKMSFLVTKQIRKTIWNHIREKANNKGICVDFINGYTDYYRCLIAIDDKQKMDKMTKMLKGEWSFRINKKGISTDSSFDELPPISASGIKDQLEWDDNYFTIVIAESDINNANKDIVEQTQSIKKSSKIFDELKIEYGFQKVEVC